jgi:uncharacterized membrane protein YeaQ/YmgE (transglycosylase-associated protein family)
VATDPGGRHDHHRNPDGHRDRSDLGALGRLVLPGKQRIPIWLTILVGIVAALVGTALARALGIPTETSGIDWLELLVQVLVAALGVALVSGLYGRRRSRLRL